MAHVIGDVRSPLLDKLTSLGLSKSDIELVEHLFTI